MNREVVLCVKTNEVKDLINSIGYTDIDLLSFVEENYGWISRNFCETNPDYKQIIPYCVIKVDDKYLVVQRNKGGEKRLDKKYSIGIGGHCNDAFLFSNQLVQANLYRELEEELGTISINSIDYFGVVNDDSNDVGKVHLGLVYIVNLHFMPSNEDDFSYFELHSKEELINMSENLETWSKLLLNNL